MTRSLTLPAPARAASPAAAIASLLMATSAWGSLFFVGKSMLAVLDPLWFTTIRYVLATLLLVALRPAFGGAPLTRLVRDLRPLALLGLAGYGAFSVLVFFGVALSVPSHGAVIMATMPVTTVLLRWWLDGVRPPRTAVAAAGLALVGVALVAGVFAHRSGVSTRALFGDLLALVGTLGWVTYTRGAARFPDLSPFDYTAFTAMASVPALLAVAVVASITGLAPWPDAGAVLQRAPTLAYIAVVPTVAAAVAFNFGVRRLGAATGTLFINCVPISALLIATALGQPPGAQEILGAVLVGLALVVTTRPVRSASPAPLRQCGATS
jgi:drug/metabolite transporter (DMT)-like permease